MIRTKNLIIRKVSHRHVDALFRIYGDVENNAYNPLPPFPNIEHSQSVLNTWIEHWSAKDIGNHAISMTSDEDCIIGFGGFSFKRFRGKEVLSLGYKFTPDVWGNGYATEFVNGIIENTVLPENVIEVIARTHPENIASIRVLEKTGFIYLEIYDDNDGMGLSAVFSRKI
ncbi:GNAT family N-acetyltransferase [Pantoea sp. GL120224-02]|uniref:GNAT family N-acetyltransferase n=1 Tax=Pantoea sp. GL120224-02 TaxID=1378084 RepID=UPI000BCBA581|nr:GNAT family N-acetyltransferase [Pantoea sp. GL120224-02]SNY74658.1 Protein N-acetyltransferase, RimJ/RimL family [Pantoea sp. GL120224-02]SNY79295.1 Protein N-acetyltransferase, RimJ/RimL family [Pantoea sp. GL120224-02]SNY79996.1 Protein N-acetyltransferase, RimJ/RimL family [Pantoea sp. GL120224-02]